MDLRFLDWVWSALGNKVDPRTGFSIYFSLYNPQWAWGWFDPYVRFGFGVLVLGPLHVRVTWPLSHWPIDEWPVLPCAEAG